MNIKLSPYHEIFYNEWKLDPKSSKYNIVFDQTLASTLDVLRLRESLSRLVSDYLLLNSHICEIDNISYWVPNDEIKQLAIFENSYNEELFFDYISQPFNLQKEPLYRFAIFSDKGGNYRFITVLHHLLIDGGSCQEFISQFSKYYNSSTYQPPFSLAIQRSIISIATDLYKKQLQDNSIKYKNFWNLALVDSEPVDIRFLRPNNIPPKPLSVKYSNLREIRFNFCEDDLLKLSQITCEYGTTTYMYSQCIFAILLYRYTHQKKFAISYPIAIEKDINFICGARVNTMVIPYCFEDNMTIIDMFKQNNLFIKSLKEDSIDYRHYPINEILATSHKDLFNVVFSQTCLRDDEYNFVDTKLVRVNHQLNVDIVAPLYFEQELKNSKLNFRVRYNDLEVDGAVLSHFVKCYKKLFIDVLNNLIQSNKAIAVSKYPIAGNSIVVGKAPQNSLPIGSKFCSQEKMLHKLFEEQAKQNPNNIVIVTGSRVLTYKQLNIAANKLAHYLIGTQKVLPGDLITLCFDKDEYMLIAILAVLKAGAAYVPLDPNCPDKRMNFILEDTKTKWLLTNKNYLDNLFNLSNLAVKIISIDSGCTNIEIDKCLESNPVVRLSSVNLAYVIYTSGTTGKPKGVLQPHYNVVNLFESTNHQFNFTAKDVWVLFHSYAFDFAVWEMFGALINGGKLIIPTFEQTKDLNIFYNLCKNEGVTVLNQTPAAFYSFAEIALNNSKLTNLRYIILGGDVLTPSNLIPWFNCYGDSYPQIVNMYGITETTVHVTYKLITVDQINVRSLIGVPIANKSIYILDEFLNVVPLGAIGEMYVGGEGVACGYLNAPELTREKFLANPFQTDMDMVSDWSSKLYKSGDLARLLPNGELEYIGRNDQQVKIRGFRIEPGEIENILNQYTGIKKSLVLVPDNNAIGKYLVGYYVAAEKIEEQKIINYLMERLPEYMVPGILVHLETFPLTINGKLDKSALPVPNFILDEYVAPNNEFELTICKAYANVLNLPQQKIGINHDFFRLGGNSLLAIRLVAELQSNFRVMVNDIFKFRTPHKIAKVAIFVKDNLQHKLSQVQLFYTKLNNHKEKDTLAAYRKKVTYLDKINNLEFTQEFKDINTVLLAGATGYLGCNLLYQLLETTQYTVYLPVRGDSEGHAYKRLEQKFNFYFSLNINNYQDRIVVFAADIGKEFLGLEKFNYDELVSRIDSIIHAAASVRHYGDYEDLYHANVITTINLLNLSKLTKLKDFHYISTLSVFMGGYIPDCSYYTFSEYDDNSILKNQDNLYAQTKYMGELATIDYRAYGVNTNIYRVGNLAMHSINYKCQENIEENAFFNKIKTILHIGVLPKELSEVEISPVDCVAAAVIKLFKQKSLSNDIYHVFNPSKADLLKIFSTYGDVDVRMVSFNSFISIIRKCLLHINASRQVELFMLHQCWLQDIDLNCITKIDILQDKTSSLLSKLGFTWPEISGKMLSDIINHSFRGIKQIA